MNYNLVEGTKRILANLKELAELTSNEENFSK